MGHISGIQCHVNYSQDKVNSILLFRKTWLLLKLITSNSLFFPKGSSLEPKLTVAKCLCSIAELQYTALTLFLMSDFTISNEVL